MSEDFQIAIVVVLGTVFFIGIAGFVVLSVSRYLNEKASHVREVNELKEKFDTEMLQVQLEVKEETLNTISEEIHDNIGQVLSLANLNLHQLKGEINNPRLDSTSELVSQSIKDLREVSHMLSKNSLEDNDLISLMEKEINQINKAGAFKGELTISEEEELDLDGETSLMIYRMVQETIQNSIKHAHPSLLKINVTSSLLETYILVEDDGNGFDVEDAMKRGNGLQNLQRRADLIGAQITWQSSEDKGTATKIELLNARDKD